MRDATTARALVVIAGRLFAGLLDEADRLPLGSEVWADTTVQVALPDGSELENVLTGETVRVEHGSVRVADAFASFPAAALRFSEAASPSADGQREQAA